METDYELPATTAPTPSVTKASRLPNSAITTTKTSQLRLQVHDVAIRVARCSPTGDLWVTAEVAFTPSHERQVREQMREVLAKVEEELNTFINRRRYAS